MGDLTALIDEDKADVCVLEEPEHLNWYRAPGDSWTTKFKYVVGVVHTNYFVYASEQVRAGGGAKRRADNAIHDRSAAKVCQPGISVHDRKLWHDRILPPTHSEPQRPSLRSPPHVLHRSLRRLYVRLQ